jgi:membrane dipeptidase
MDRRTFLRTSSTWVAFASTGAAARAASNRASSAAGLYRRAMVIDANLAPGFEDTDPLPLPEEDLARYRSCGVTVMKASLGGFGDGFEDTLKELAFYQQVIEVHPDVFMQVREAGDFSKAKRESRHGIIFSFEGVNALEGKIERIELFRHLGVRVMQLSYNLVSPFAAGVLAPPDAPGLTELGRAALDRMNKLGIAVDLSHAGPATTQEVMAHSTVPVIITHGGCAALHAHPRNKTDEQLRALVAKGGVFGIYDLPYLTASPKQPDIRDYMQHLLHALNVCGEDHIGIGSDQTILPFDDSEKALEELRKDEEARHAAGVAAPEEDRPLYVMGLNVPNRCELIAEQLLAQGYSARVTEKVLGLNFERVLTEIWKS